MLINFHPSFRKRKEEKLSEVLTAEEIPGLSLYLPGLAEFDKERFNLFDGFNTVPDIVIH
jgi:hypothetical protein